MQCLKPGFVPSQSQGNAPASRGAEYDATDAMDASQEFALVLPTSRLRSACRHRTAAMCEIR